MPSSKVLAIHDDTPNGSYSSRTTRALWQKSDAATAEEVERCPGLSHVQRMVQGQYGHRWRQADMAGLRYHAGE